MGLFVHVDEGPVNYKRSTKRVLRLTEVFLLRTSSLCALDANPSDSDPKLFDGELRRAGGLCARVCGAPYGGIAPRRTVNKRRGRAETPRPAGGGRCTQKECKTGFRSRCIMDCHLIACKVLILPLCKLRTKSPISVKQNFTPELPMILFVCLQCAEIFAFLFVFAVHNGSELTSCSSSPAEGTQKEQ